MNQGKVPDGDLLDSQTLFSYLKMVDGLLCEDGNVIVEVRGCMMKGLDAKIHTSYDQPFSPNRNLRYTPHDHLFKPRIILYFQIYSDLLASVELS